MLNKYLLKEGRPSRPKKVFPAVGFISLLIIVLSTGFYFLCAYVPLFKEPINSFRLKFLFISNEFDFSGIDALKIIICVPVTVIGCLIGGINLVRMSNRKGFLSFLHILPGIGIIILILGSIFYFIVPHFVFEALPFDFAAMLPYIGYVGGAAIWAVGIIIADIFSFFYGVMNYYQFHPVYKSYHQALRAARTNTDKSRIRHYFYYYWKKKRYDDMLRLLYVEKNVGKEVLDVDSYVYFRDGAVGHMAEERARELDELYESEQYDILERELNLLSSDKTVKPELATKKEEPKAKKEEPVDEGETTFYLVEDEELNSYGKRQIAKGRRRAANLAAREKAKAMRREEKAARRARRGH